MTRGPVLWCGWCEGYGEHSTDNCPTRRCPERDTATDSGPAGPLVVPTGTEEDKR